MQKTKTVSASEFKVHCLEYLENTRTIQAEYIVTKRGKAVAKLVPIQEPHDNFVFGKMKDSIVIKDDILAPIDVEWSL